MRGYATWLGVVPFSCPRRPRCDWRGKKGGAPPGKATHLVVTGPASLAGKPLAEQPLRDHGRYILNLHVKGSLKFAGPFLDDTGGAAVFEAATERKHEPWWPRIPR